MSTSVILSNPLSAAVATRIGLSSRSYAVGETVTVSDATAKTLVGSGYARYSGGDPDPDPGSGGGSSFVLSGTPSSGAMIGYVGSAWTVQTPTQIKATLATAIADVSGLGAALALLAPQASPTFTGTPAGPTASAGTNSTQLATTAFVRAEVAALVGSAPSALDTLTELATALGNDPNAVTTLTTAISAKAPLVSPALTGTPTAPTASAGTNSTQLATTAYVDAGLARGAAVYNVKTAGAVGNGTADDSSALHTARDAAGTNATVYVPAGTYITSGLVLSVAGQTWQLAPGAVIKQKAATAPTAIVDVTASGVRISGGKIDGNRAAQTVGGDFAGGIGVRISNVSNVVVSETSIVDCRDMAAFIDVVTDVTIRRCNIANCGVGLNRKAIVLWYTGDSTNVRIEDNIIDGTTSLNGGIAVTNQAATVTGVRITGNRILVGTSPSDDTLGIEVFTSGATGGIDADVIVSGNQVLGSAGPRVFGISVGGVTDSSSTGDRRIVVSGNEVRDCPQIAVEVIGSGVTVSGNTAINCGPITVNGGQVVGGLQDVTVTGNTVTGSTSYAMAVLGGTTVGNGVNGVVIAGNVFHGTYVSFQGIMTDVLFASNTCRTPAGGIAFSNNAVPTRVKIHGNVINATGSSSVQDGIILPFTGGVGIEISDNYIVGAGRHGIYGLNPATDILITGNVIRGSAQDGIRTTSGCANWTIINNIISGNGGWGVILAGSPAGALVHANVTTGNTSGEINLGSATLRAVGPSSGVVTRSLAGTPSDASWSSAPPDGTVVVDSSGSKIWARVGGAWKSAALT